GLSCEGGAGCGGDARDQSVLGLKAVAACIVVDLPTVFPSVKQRDGDDGSAAVTPAAVTPSTAPARPEQPAPGVKVAVSIQAPGVRGYQVDDNYDVRRFLDQFQTGYRRAIVERWLTRAGRYLPMVLDVFKQKGLPEELVFTAMIESGFDPLAVSRAGAQGLGQFMAPTPRRDGP